MSNIITASTVQVNFNDVTAISFSGGQHWLKIGLGTLVAVPAAVARRLRLEWAIEHSIEEDEFPFGMTGDLLSDYIDYRTTGRAGS